MPTTFALTNEGDEYLMAVLDERLSAGDIVLRPLTSIFGGSADTFGWGDLAAHTDSGFVTTGFPGFFLGGQTVGSAGQLYSYRQWFNWRATNSTGSAKGIFGYVVIDEVREKVLFCSTVPIAGSIANGGFKDFNLLVALDNGTGALP